MRVPPSQSTTEAATCRNARSGWLRRSALVSRVRRAALGAPVPPGAVERLALGPQRSPHRAAQVEAAAAGRGPVAARPPHRQHHRELADGQVGLVPLGLGQVLEGLDAQHLDAAGDQPDGHLLVALVALVAAGLAVQPFGLADQHLDLPLDRDARLGLPAGQLCPQAVPSPREPLLERQVVGVEILFAGGHGEPPRQVQAVAVETAERGHRAAERQKPPRPDGQSPRAQQPAEADQPFDPAQFEGGFHERLPIGASGTRSGHHSGSSTSSSLARTSSRSSWSLTRARSVATARATCLASTSGTSGARTRTMSTSRSTEGWSIQWYRQRRLRASCSSRVRLEVMITAGGRSAATRPISGMVTANSLSTSSRNASNSSSARSSSSISSTAWEPARIAASSGRSTRKSGPNRSASCSPSCAARTAISWRE